MNWPGWKGVDDLTDDQLATAGRDLILALQTYSIVSLTNALGGVFISTLATHLANPWAWRISHHDSDPLWHRYCNSCRDQIPAWLVRTAQPVQGYVDIARDWDSMLCEGCATDLRNQRHLVTGR